MGWYVSDVETGIGPITDKAIARASRLGVGHGGRSLIPVMEMQGLFDADLRVVVSYRESRPTMHHLVPAHEYGDLRLRRLYLWLPTVVYTPRATPNHGMRSTVSGRR